MISSESRGVMSGSINNGYSSFPNFITFELGKRRKDFNGSEGDEFIIGNGTPTGNKKIQLIKTSPASPQPDAGVQSYKTNTQISEIEDRICLKRCGAEKIVKEEKVDAGGSLDMLVDAIRLIEGQKLHIIVDQLAQGKDLIPENKSNLGRPNLQNEQFRANDCLEASNNCNGISKGVEIDSSAVLRTRSRGGRLPTLPSKYSDSVLQPWKKVARKCPNLLKSKGIDVRS